MKNYPKRLMRNKDLKNFQSDDIDFEEMLLLMENISKGYASIFYNFYDFFRLAAKNKWAEAFPSIKTVANASGVKPKTVERFLNDGACLIQRVNRFKNNRKTSNKYFIQIRFIKFMNLFRRVGVFKCLETYKEKIKFIRDMWEKSGHNLTRLINMLTTPNSFKNNGLDISYERRKNKMSHTPSEKCRIDPYSPYSYLQSLCTGIVPPEKVKEFAQIVNKKLKKAVERYKWYTQDQKNVVYKPIGFLVNALNA